MHFPFFEMLQVIRAVLTKPKEIFFTLRQLFWVMFCKRLFNTGSFNLRFCVNCRCHKGH